MRSVSRAVWLAAAVGLAAGVATGKDIELRSGWRGAPAGPAGTSRRWEGRLAPLGELPILVGIENDARFLYVCVRTSDPKLKARIARVGLTVWANGEGRDRRGYGLRFPAGGGFVRDAEAGRAEGERPRGPGAEGGGERGGLELIGPTEDDRLTVAASGPGPVKAELEDDSGVMVIELRLPLAPTDEHPLAVGATPGRTVALGFETAPPRSGEVGEGRGGADRGREGDGGEGGRGGFGGGEGGRGGFGGGEGGRGGFGGSWGGRGGGAMGRGTGGPHDELTSPLKVWTRVTLALPPAPAQP